MQVHKLDVLETGSSSQFDIFSQSRACCESDAARQVSRLSDDDNEESVDVLAHPLASASPRLTKIV